MSGEDTGISRHARWSVATFLVGTRFSQIHRVLKGEVSHVVHGLHGTLGLSGSENDWVLQHDITFVGDQLAASSAKRKRLDQACGCVLTQR